MHNDVPLWVQTCLDQIAESPKTVLDLGGRDVNGTLRHLFPNIERYTVVDIRPGPNVDIVANAAQVDLDDRFDLILCTETFEHTPYGEGICWNAERLLKPGGYFICTTAWTCRAPHSGIDGRPLSGNEWSSDMNTVETQGREYYANVDEATLGAWMSVFAKVDINVYGCDIRAFGRKGE